MHRGDSTEAQRRHGRDSEEEAWTIVEGEYMSVMAVVMPCRSDKSKKGANKRVEQLGQSW